MRFMDGIIEAAVEGDEELTEDYARHDFNCHYHYSYVCNDPEGRCTAKQEGK